MNVRIFNRTLRRSFMAGAVVLLGANACSRPDQAESGSSNTGNTTQDTALTGATQDVPGTAQDRMATDTTNPTGENTGTGAAAGDTAPANLQSNAPRAATASPGADRSNTSAPADSGAGYPAAGRDTTAGSESDSARVTADTGETSLNQADTGAVETTGAAVIADTTTTDTASTVGYAEMARDTTGSADRIDTMTNAAVGADVQDSTMNAGRVRPIEDSTETMGQVTTDTGSVADRADSDTADAAVAARGDDTIGNAGRIRPPEDSTEMQGNVSSAESAGVNAADTADEAPVMPEAREFDTNDRETEIASETRDEAAGAAAVGGTVTGSDAVAMMTRQGGQCNVVDPESDEEVRWDMSSTPATLNPCGLGSMNLSKVWTEKR